ncbi:tail fiber protein [Photorhabdus australis]|uniref:tail fiber protein n=1 Tax=Photorhabdus australis TaxID=286156 RepID=UPI00068D0172|nr:tail fiber protein [Photorhabdus australis]
METVELAKSAVPSSRKINGKALSGDVNITSQDIFEGQAISIPEKADLNDYKTPGLYYQVSTAQAISGKNYPEGSAGSLVILKGNGVIQRYHIVGSTRAYTRGFYSGSGWSAWAQEYNTLNKPTAEDVGALAGMKVFNYIPGNEYLGVFSAHHEGYEKGINFGFVNYDSGQIYVNSSGDLYAYFLHVNKNRYGGLVNTFPVGSPILWPLPTAPAGYFTCNGQAFNKSLYPRLAAAYPSGALPDLRGEFIRGWDDGRGIDPGRVCGSWQEDALQNITGSIGMRKGVESPRAAGAFTAIFKKIADSGHTGENWGVSGDWNFDASLVARTANETRPRNIAFNYIVRAA